MRSRSATVRTA
jgi:hypothetical protein